MMQLKRFLNHSFLYNLFSLARFSHAKKYLLKNIRQKRDPYFDYVLAKDKMRSLNIWALKQIKNRRELFNEDLYFWELEGEKWLANLDHIHGLYEYLSGSFSNHYRANYQNKTVLDVGGYIGDTARYFLKEGAARVVIYEPVEKNVICMKHNLHKWSHLVEIVHKGVSGNNGEMVISSNYPAGHIGFGNREGQYSVKVSSETFHTILQKNSADIAKIDCEGGERYLLDLEERVLCKIPYWMVEIHEAHLVQEITRKFRSCGFEILPVDLPPGHQALIHFCYGGKECCASREFGQQPIAQLQNPLTILTKLL